MTKAMDNLHRIVVGIDFGTTYTAVAWAEASNPNQIEIIRNWPTSGQLVGPQVPSEIAYSEEDRNVFSWGYNISPDRRKIKWFKLGVEVDVGSDVLKLPDGLTAADAVQDYLGEIYKHTMTTLYRRFERTIMQTTIVDFVLTVPAIWSDAAKQITAEGAARAGIGNEHSLQLLSEPESAAVYTLKNLDTTNSQVRVHDRIVVCDAGGGTVDLITYDIEQITPTLRVSECAPGVGDFCGSTFIDREFEKLFINRMGSHYNNVSAVNRQHTIKNFETAKLAFRNDPLQNKFYVNVPTVGSLESAGVFGGNFEISRAEMRSLFDPIVDQIIELIKAQVDTVTRGPHVVNSILLVGGFGESEYLYQKVQAWANTLRIQVIQPREAATAIVRGAVLKGLEPRAGEARTAITRRARRSYGVPINAPFIDGKHSERDAMIDPQTGQKLAKDQVSWFIRKDQALPDDQVFRHTFYRSFKTISMWKDTLVACSTDHPPSRIEPPIVRLCTITSDLTHLNKSTHFTRRWRRCRPYYTAKYDIVLGVRDSHLTFMLECQGQRFGVASVDFD